MLSQEGEGSVGALPTRETDQTRAGGRTARRLEKTAVVLSLEEPGEIEQPGFRLSLITNERLRLRINLHLWVGA